MLIVDRNGLRKAVMSLLKRLARVQRHQVFTASCIKTREPDWLPGERVYFLSQNRLTDQVVSEQLVSLSAQNRAYLEAVSRGEAEGLAVLCDGKAVHYAFLIRGNKTVRLLGFGKSAGLMANAFTVDSYRGRGCHARSVAARLKMAERSGLDLVISETSYDNAASQRGLVKGGMKFVGGVEFLVLLNVLVIRYRRPDNSIKRIELCW